jgi:KAP family P-loop domain
VEAAVESDGDQVEPTLAANGPEPRSVPPRPSFLRDAPDLGEDAFGHGDYSDTLFSIVQDAEPPRTIGLFGPWGVGKSTIIGGLKERLAPTATAFVYFDAWRYEDDSLRRQFLLETAGQLSAARRLWGSYKVDKELRELEVDTQELQDSFRLSWRSFLRAGALALVFGAFTFLAANLGVFDMIIEDKPREKFLLALATTLLAFLASAFSQSVAVDTVTITRRTLQDPDQFTRKFRELLESLVPERLVIAVDNLDRSSPEKAVELLATIKTYLEPTAAGDSPLTGAQDVADGKEVIFVIAVDDEALRRHLIAREQSASQGFDLHAARRYVDEYLAKFFSARLPVRTILGDDMRGYVEHYLGPLAELRGVSEEERRRLVSLVENGLRGNPRGVKQFFNDLEARLRLLEERERAKKDGKPGISPPVSDQVAMVAKLALIEREWPEAFARLQEDPRLLAGWTRAARTQPAINWDQELVDLESLGLPAPPEHPPMVPAAMGVSAYRSHREFASFLRIAATVESKEIRALLSLKQSAIELDLPGFSEFREAILSGDRAAASEVLGRAEEAERQGMAARVPRLLSEEVERRYLDVAREIVGASIDIPELFDDVTVRRQVMSAAAVDPELRRELVNLRASVVLAAGQILDLHERRLLLDPFLDRFHDVQASEVRGELAADIGPFLDDLNPLQRSTLRGALAAAYRADFADYLPLVDSDPELLPLEALDSALEHLAEPGNLGADPQAPAPISSRQPAAIGVIKIGLATGMDEGRRQILVATVGRIFGAVLVDGEAARRDLPILTDLIAAVELEDPQPFVDLARTIPVRWNEIAEVARAGVIELAGALLSHCEEGVAEEIAEEITHLLFGNPGNAFGLIVSMAQVPEPFLESFARRLGEWTGRPEEWAAAGDALRDLDPAAFSGRVLEAFAQLLRTGHPEQALELLGRYEGDLGRSTRRIGSAAAPILTERVRTDAPGPVALLDRVVPLLSSGALGDLAGAYAEALEGPSGPAVKATLEELSGKALRLSDEVAERAVARLDVGGGPLLEFVVGRAGHLPKEAQEQFGIQIAARLTNDPTQLPAIASALGENATNLRAEPATRIADALLGLERELADPPLRRIVFALALTLRRQKGSRVETMLKTRLDEMAQSPDETDRQLAAEVSAEIPD